MNQYCIVLVAALYFSLLLFSDAGYGQTQTSAQLLEVAPADLPQRRASPDANAITQEARQQLQQVQGLINEKREQINSAREQLATETNKSRLLELQALIAQGEIDLNSYMSSFESITLGGLDMGVFNRNGQDEKFNWQQEMQLILQPLFQKLKEMTEKPRQAERLKNQLALLNSQQRTVQRAQEHIMLLRDNSLDEDTSLHLEDLQQTWSRQLGDIQREQDISQLQLNQIASEDETILRQARRAMNEFFTGSGLNLTLAITAFFLTLFLMKGVYVFYNRITSRENLGSSTGRRMLVYGYQALTLITSVTVALLVLYMLGDMLLITLALIMLVLILLGLRNYLPRFIDESKLLLNIGAVRQQERVVYQGLPWLVRTLGVYTQIYNPALEGLLRLPLTVVLGLVSRPYEDDEPWFPTRIGDWVMLSDGTVGQVLRQTPEVVQLKSRGSVRNYITTNFIANEPQNLSGGFLVWITFGIDYQHQSDSTTEIPDILQQAIEAGLNKSEQAEQVEKVSVEFMEAGASSLNYFVIVGMNGAAADSYFRLPRLLQRICVDTCNEHGWVIPFSQLTVHAGTGFEAGTIKGAVTST